MQIAVSSENIEVLLSQLGETPTLDPVADDIRLQLDLYLRSPPQHT
ncbi:MAG: hypothetical protein ACRDRR_15715 [Pseudonocardiaceae bacterium]